MVYPCFLMGIEMRTYKLTISYDGTRYKGWQKQGLTDCTIQQILEDTATKLVGYPIELDGSGRTDSGVHAKGQVASMKVSGILYDTFLDEWNELLPDNIKVVAMELWPRGFHGRYSAVAKRYSYRVDTREVASVFYRKYACHYPQKLDVDAMQKAASYLKGTYDFSAFTDDKTEKSKVRTIYDIAIQKDRNNVVLSFYGNGFLYHMVRILVGTLLQIGTGEKQVDDIKVMLKEKDRSYAGFLAPAKGLCLEEVYYGGK